MNSRQRRKWEKTRTIGKRRFVWTRGVLIWGFTTGILWTVMSYYLEGDFQYSFDNNADILRRLLLSLVAFSFIGYFWGCYVWQVSERRYNRK